MTKHKKWLKDLQDVNRDAKEADVAEKEDAAERKQRVSAPLIAMTLPLSCALELHVYDHTLTLLPLQFKEHAAQQLAAIRDAAQDIDDVGVTDGMSLIFVVGCVYQC
jgi:hypothetical protein